MRSYVSLDGMLSYLENINMPLFSAVSLPTGIDRQTMIDTIYQDGAEFGVIYPDPTFFRNRVNAWFLTKYKTFDKWNTVLNMEYNPIENYDRMEAWTDSGTISDTGARTDTGTSHDTNESTTTLNGSTTTENETSGTTSETGRKQTDTTGSETDNDSKTEIIDQDGTSTSTTSATTTTETKVSAFNDGGYQPKEQVISSSTTTVNGATTNDQTTTTTDRLTKSTTGQEIEQSTNSGTTSETEEGSETRHDVTNFESESNGRTTLESHTTGSRESDGEHEGRVHGNIGVTTTQQMIEQEMSLRKNYNIYNLISDSFCDEFLIQVY